MFGRRFFNTIASQSVIRFGKNEKNTKQFIVNITKCDYIKYQGGKTITLGFRDRNYFLEYSTEQDAEKDLKSMADALTQHYK